MQNILKREALWALLLIALTPFITGIIYYFYGNSFMVKVTNIVGLGVALGFLIKIQIKGWINFRNWIGLLLWTIAAGVLLAQSLGWIWPKPWDGNFSIPSLVISSALISFSLSYLAQYKHLTKHWSVLLGSSLVFALEVFWFYISIVYPEYVNGFLGEHQILLWAYKIEPVAIYIMIVILVGAVLKDIQQENEVRLPEKALFSYGVRQLFFAYGFLAVILLCVPLFLVSHVVEHFESGMIHYEFALETKGKNPWEVLLPFPRHGQQPLIALLPKIVLQDLKGNPVAGTIDLIETEFGPMLRIKTPDYHGTLKVTSGWLSNKIDELKLDKEIIPVIVGPRFRKGTGEIFKTPEIIDKQYQQVVETRLYTNQIEPVAIRYQFHYAFSTETDKHSSLIFKQTIPLDTGEPLVIKKNGWNTIPLQEEIILKDFKF